MKPLKPKNILDEITPLLEPQAGKTISLYIPTSPLRNKTKKSKILLKNNLKKITDKSYKKLVDKIIVKTKSKVFWKELSFGLCIYVSEGIEKYLVLPNSIKSSIYNGPYFNIKPLLKHLIDSSNYYVLVLNLGKIELLECTDKYYRKIEIENIPSSMQNLLWADDPEKQIKSVSTGSSSKGSMGQVSFHGQGGFKSAEQKNLLKFFRKIDEYIFGEINSTQIRVIYAGLEEQFHEYKNISKLNLGDEFISGSFNTSDYQRIVNKAWKIIQLENEKIRLDAIQQYKNSISSEITTTDIDEIAKFANNGRVDTLFVENLKPKFNRKLGNTKNDLVNLSMIHTLKNGGKVFKIRKGDYQIKTSLAALLRF
ncbi:hypothetical protein ACFL0C_01375 [Patescibacteria group bacterium]